ncbi:MAG: DNA polymerase I [Candidatus Moranbacteria bacterium]|nr:DNA polymerase I [Candidatus Moranbacteria bacterium]MBP6034443.1 DNA polymerase I [Candidatus Moranbacteria bacterium]MBP7696057.1 DNA polymerase I [Candidatus Moranbacteria bacterium]
MENKPKTLVLLDGNALIHRAYHALPPLTTKTGETVHAVYGFTMTLLSVLEKFRPEYIAASFDLHGPTFRDELYAEYKATRTAAPDDLYAQIPRVKEMTTAFNIPIYELPGYEADDCVGTIAKQAGAQGVDVIIVTGDNDALQLVDDHVKVFSIRKGLKDLVLYDRAAVEAKYGFGPELVPDYKGLAGDTSDNIPGVKGIGEKGATGLLQEFGTLENIYAHLGDIKEALRKKLESDREIAFLSKRLGTIDIAAPVELRLEDCVTHDFDREKVETLLKEFEFFSLIKKIPTSGNQPVAESGAKAGMKKVANKKLKSAEDIAAWLETNTGKGIAIALSETADSLFGNGIEMVELATAVDAQVSLEWNPAAREALREFLEHPQRPKILFDAKRAMHLLSKEGVTLRSVARDVSLINYLIAAGGRNEMPELLLREFGSETTETGAASLYALNALLGERIKEISAAQTAGKTLLSVYADIELPLIPILFRMEERGIRLNTEIFKTMSDEMTTELATLEHRIYDLSGRTFNINSPKQLAEVLFTDLAIPTTNIKKNKTGISTASTELEKLRAEYPIVAEIEQYRELFKLKTTYLDALPKLVDAHSRVHTTYHQTIAATGRLSSTEPNLQNIPARQAWSERIRGAFEAEPGNLFVGADYSQIELRIAAHLSADTNLTEAFVRGEDIHRKTAAVVFGVEPEAVTGDMRRQAKVFNFGILYGMGAFGLAQAADIDQKSAGKFIEAYFERFSGVAQYLEVSKTFAREHGYVETELGRRRSVPEIQSHNVQVARSGERMAVNMPVQGLAADIMKLAMIAADQMAETKYPGTARMLLQVHDEIIFEVQADIAEAFARDLKQSMEGVYALKVPLIAETAIGKNWGEI